jgi:hypothetical protein
MGRQDIDGRVTPSIHDRFRVLSAAATSEPGALPRRQKQQNRRAQLAEAGDEEPTMRFNGANINMQSNRDQLGRFTVER